MQWDFFVTFIILIISGITFICSGINCGILEQYKRKYTREYKISKTLVLISGLILICLIIIIFI